VALSFDDIPAAAARRPLPAQLLASLAVCIIGLVALAGPRGPAVASSRFVLVEDGRPVVVVDPASGRTSPLGGFVAGHVRQPLATANGTVVVVSDGRAVAVRTGAGAAVTLGFADVVLPSANPNAVWLVAFVSGGPAASVASEVQVDGTLATPPRPVPAGWFPVAATAGGLIVSEFGEFSQRRLATWRPGPGPTSAPIPFGDGTVVDTRGPLVAWVSGTTCRGEPCPLHVTDVLVAGADRTVAAPGPAHYLGTGAFSPAGDRLAVLTEGPLIEHHRSALLTVLDVASGGLEMAPTPIVYSGGIVAWSPGGAEVFYAEGDIGADGTRLGTDRVLRYRPADDAADTVPVTLRPRAFLLVI
jgi:hypothetical protein